MRRLLPLILAISFYARAQSPQELLRLAQAAYKSPEGYQIAGKGSAQLPGSSWQISFAILIAASPSPPANPQIPAIPGGRITDMQYVNTIGGIDEKPTSMSVPFVVTGAWSRMAENVASISEIGSESLPLNGKPTACRVLAVEYKIPEGVPKPPPTTYSICSEKHLVLKKVTFYPAGRHPIDPLVPWTVVFDTARFNRPAPQWLLDMKDWPNVTTRKEWVGRRAPDFKLADLNGNTISLSSLRGKVILLDFWSTSCGPCIREMPMIEAVGEAHKMSVVLWGISFDQPDQDKKWLLQHQRTLPTLFDTDYITSDVYKVHGIPALVLIGRSGIIKNYWQGEVSRAELEAAIHRATKD